MIGSHRNFLFINTISYRSPHTWLVCVGTVFRLTDIHGFCALDEKKSCNEKTLDTDFSKTSVLTLEARTAVIKQGH